MALTIFSLSILAVGFLLVLLTLQRRVPALEAKEQAFRFHSLRDQLQLLAVGGCIETGSTSYTVLMRMLNVAIRNPRLMKLRDMLWMAEAAKDTLSHPTFEEFQKDIQRHDQSVQKLAQDCFAAYMVMLISNDSIVRLAFKGVNWAVANWTALKPILVHSRALFKCVVPAHTEAVDLARWYSHKQRMIGAV